MQTIAHIHTLYRGRSFPSKVETTTGQTCLMKIRGAGSGVRSLIQEFLVNHLASAMTWRVPAVFPLSLPDGFLLGFDTHGFDEVWQRSYGVNLGMAHVANAVCVSSIDWLSLPRDLLCQMAAIDAFFCNEDRTEGGSSLLRGGAGDYWLIDHGACQILDTSAAMRPIALGAKHVLKEHEANYLSWDLMRAMTHEDLMSDAVHDLPMAWLQELGMTRWQIWELLTKRRALLDSLS